MYNTFATLAASGVDGFRQMAESACEQGGINGDQLRALLSVYKEARKGRKVERGNTAFRDLRRVIAHAGLSGAAELVENPDGGAVFTAPGILPVQIGPSQLLKVAAIVRGILAAVAATADGSAEPADAPPVSAAG